MHAYAISILNTFFIYLTALNRKIKVPIVPLPPERMWEIISFISRVYPRSLFAIRVFIDALHSKSWNDMIKAGHLNTEWKQGLKQI